MHRLLYFTFTTAAHHH